MRSGEVVLFCHGLESGPEGRKSAHLQTKGFAVIAPDGRGLDLAARVELLTAVLLEHRPPLLVGSSFGGIAGLLAAMRVAENGVVVRGLLLCAPALGWPREGPLEGPLRCPGPTIILHGTRDEVVPIAGSRAFAQAYGAELVEVDDDHRLTHSLDAMVQLIRRL